MTPLSPSPPANLRMADLSQSFQSTLGRRLGLGGESLKKMQGEQGEGCWLEGVDGEWEGEPTLGPGGGQMGRGLASREALVLGG